MVSINITSCRFAAVVTGLVVALSACGHTDSDTSAAQSGPVPLGSANRVSGKEPGWGGAEFEGTVTIGSKPTVCQADNGSRVLVFHVQVATTKGAIPTSSWRVQTENAMPVENENVNLSDIGGPHLGSPVTGEAKGDIAFTLPAKTTPTTIELLGARETFSSSPATSLATWSTGNLSASTMCPASAQTTAPSYYPGS